MIHPDLPVIGVKNENELYSTLIDVIENKEIDWIGAEGKRYVLEHHHPEVVAKQWNYLINHVTTL
jgi:cytolysin (calcineurin-like family phosphatase)